MSALGSLGGNGMAHIGTRDLELHTDVYTPTAAPLRLTITLASGSHEGHEIDLMLGGNGSHLCLWITNKETGKRVAVEEINLATLTSAWAGAALADLELTTVVAEHNAAAETKENDE